MRCLNFLDNQRSYLIKSIYQWCCDNELTPYLVAVVDNYTQVPQQYVEDNQIIFNISPLATKELLIDDEHIRCDMTFNNEPFQIYLPIGNVIAIFAKENASGIEFDPCLIGNEDDYLTNQENNQLVSADNNFLHLVK